MINIEYITTFLTFIQFEMYVRAAEANKTKWRAKERERKRTKIGIDLRDSSFVNWRFWSRNETLFGRILYYIYNIIKYLRKKITKKKHKSIRIDSLAFSFNAFKNSEFFSHSTIDIIVVYYFYYRISSSTVFFYSNYHYYIIICLMRWWNS